VSESAPVPPSVRLGQVVPPEDPEDWRRPLTWVVAAGMLAAPALTAVWLVVAPPADPYAAIPGTAVVAAAVAAGAAVTGASQRGAWRAVLGTLGAGLFSALAVVAVGSILAAGAALGTAFVAAVAGAGGCLGAAALAGLLASAGRARRYISPALAGGIAAVLLTEALFSL
jgi:peptidoglycan/LPS O-acetylase OafA/YrhL